MKNTKKWCGEKDKSYRNSYKDNKKYKDGISKSLKTRNKSGTSEKLLDIESAPKLSKPVVVPTTLENNIYQKVKPVQKIDIKQEDFEAENDDDEIVDDVQEIIEKTTKRRGRPKRNPVEEEPINEAPKKRGRPRKNPVVDEPIYKPLEENDEEISELPIEQDNTDEQISLPGLTDTYEEEYNDDSNENIEDNDTYLPGFYDENQESEEEENYEDNEPAINIKTQSNNINSFEQTSRQEAKSLKNYDNVFDDEEFAGLFSGDKKVVSFVGTSKNGTSFIVNNLAVILSSMGIDTAILDATTNKNAYYIYTDNQEVLRQTAINCFENLKRGIANGIKVNNKLTIYTTIPSKNEQINDSRPILETLIRNHTLVLVDADFYTPIEYFDKSQEIYLVQSMDILTIQPLTEFLRELKSKNVLDERKLRIVLNKMLRLKGLSGKSIVGGMSNYNDPEMAFMTELFDRNSIRVSAQIPFDEDVYIRYLESLMDCKITTNGYPKEFKQYLVRLAEIVFPLLPGQNYKNNKKNANDYSGSFSQGMNNTLENMRKKY